MGRATGAGGGMTKGVEVAGGRVVRFDLGMGGAFGIGDRVPGERCLATDGVAGGELTKAAFDAGWGRGAATVGTSWTVEPKGLIGSGCAPHAKHSNAARDIPGIQSWALAMNYRVVPSAGNYRAAPTCWVTALRNLVTWGRTWSPAREVCP